MLSDGYWKSRFGGDRSVLGRRILVDGNACEVIGALPPWFQFMDQKVSLLVPLRFNRNEAHWGNFSYQGVAGLERGGTVQHANADIARMLRMASQKFSPPSGYSAKM